MNMIAKTSIVLCLAAAVAVPWRAGAKAETMVVVGDSLSAGYLNGSLYDKQQPHGYASVVADQAGIDLPLPLIAEPGIPPVLKLKRGTGEIVRDPGTSTGRVDPTVQSYNLAVPGATAWHALALAPDFGPPPMTRVQGMTNLVLGLPGVFVGQIHSQVGWALVLEPDVVLLWVGGQDALLGVINGTDAASTDADRFAVHFENIMNALAATDAKIIVANVPSVTDIPFVLSRAEAAAFLGVDEIVLEAVLDIAPTDSLTFDSLGPIGAALQGDFTEFDSRGLESCFVVEAENVAEWDPNVTCDDYVLTAGEITAIEAKVAAYNIAIDDVLDDILAIDPGIATLVDMNAFFANVATNGILVDDHQLLTTEFLRGVFSLDGIHPTYTAQALIADQFIAANNSAYPDDEIPPLSRQQIRAVVKSDPLVFELPGNPPPPLGPVFALSEGDTVFGQFGSQVPVSE